MQDFLGRDAHALALRTGERGRVIIRDRAAHPVGGGAGVFVQLDAGAHDAAGGRAIGATVHAFLKLRGVQDLQRQAVAVAAPAAMHADQCLAIASHGQHHHAGQVRKRQAARHVAGADRGPICPSGLDALIGVLILAAALIHHAHLQGKAFRADHIAAEHLQKAGRVAFILGQPARAVAQRGELPADIAVRRRADAARQVRHEARGLRGQPAALARHARALTRPGGHGADRAHGRRGAGAAEAVQPAHQARPIRV